MNTNIIDIIIVLFGDSSDLERCVASIEEHCSNYKINIIDNNKINRGFTKAVNEGIKAGKAPFIWLLNQDAIVLPNAQENLLKRFDYHPRVGIVGSMQIDYENRDLIRHGGTIRAFPAGVHAGGYISMGHCRFPAKQKWVNFASAMLRRAMVDTIGPLDERMFLLYSDSDYCYHARANGWEVWYEPDSRVLHRLNSSRAVTEWHHRDMQAFMDKWGIKYIGNNQFSYSPLFSQLDMFP